jgi:SAM-dependent methyltransferase
MHALANHDATSTPQGWAGVFDAAATLSPEGSVALYSLGDPGRLAMATAEVADWLRAEQLVGPEIRVLEIGCGIGRFVEALAAETALFVGLDVSPVMTAEAARRTEHLPRAAVVRTGGGDLAAFADDAFDLVLAIDSWPYIVNVGLAETLARDVARVLRPGGTFSVLNWSYRGDPGEDRADAQAIADRLGWTLDTGPAPTLHHWNGASFRFLAAGSEGQQLAPTACRSIIRSSPGL